MDVEFEVLAPAGGKPTATVIWLHGVGQDADALMPVARGLGLPRAGVRNVFPRAPVRATAVASGTPVRVWFRQTVFALDRADPHTLGDTERRLRALVAAESTRVATGRVVVAGFSQGAAMALILGLRYPGRLGGLVLYAPFLVSDARLAETRSPASAAVPVWIGHGHRDWVVPMSMGEHVRDMLRGWGHRVEWGRYPAAHEPFAGATVDLRRYFTNLTG